MLLGVFRFEQISLCQIEYIILFTDGNILDFNQLIYIK